MIAVNHFLPKIFLKANYILYMPIIIRFLNKIYSCMHCSSLLEFIQHININLYIVVIRSTVSTQNRNSELWIEQHLLVVALTTF